jgi:hypothetical protein
MNWQGTEFWDDVIDDISGTREGGLVFIIDAQDARKGVAKTSAAVFIARVFADHFGYELKEEDAHLSGKEYKKRFTEHPDSEQVSCLIWDEAVGAGSGDSRRSMSEENRVLGQLLQMERKKRVLHFITLPDWSFLDVRLQKMADYRLWCLRQPIGMFQAYEIGTQFNGSELRLRSYPTSNNDHSRRFGFGNPTVNDDTVYQHLSNQKDALLSSGDYDANEALASDGGKAEEIDPDDIRKEEKVNIAQRLRDEGHTLYEIAEAVDMSSTWASENTKNPKKD